MQSKYLIDSDAYIALYSQDDLLHNKVIKILDDLDPISLKFYTTYDVVDEVSTKLSYYHSKVLALKFIDDLLLSDTQIIYPDDEILEKTIKLFRTIKTKKVSLTDCTNMIVAKEFKIDKIFSFDQIYIKQGFEILG